MDHYLSVVMMSNNQQVMMDVIAKIAPEAATHWTKIGYCTCILLKSTD